MTSSGYPRESPANILLSSANHSYRNLRIPEDASFILQPTAKKGWGMYATHLIERNEIILCESPLFVIPNPSRSRPLEGEVRQAVQRLTRDDKEQFFSLRRNAWMLFDNLEDIFLFNKFTQDGTENPEDEAMLLLMPRVNHSCRPNAIVPSSGILQNAEIRDTYLIASEDIPAGSEITFSYQQETHYLTRADRRLALNFDCLCDEACGRDDANFQYVSDLRRTLLRGLDAIINFNISGDAKNFVNPKRRHIIADTGLREAAETMQIMNSTRFICYLMMPCVMEAEGLLSDLDANSYFMNLSGFARDFETPVNSEIADCAMRQETWVHKLLVAFHLWNRPDVADLRVAARTRELRCVEEDPDDLPEIWRGEQAIEPIIEEVD